MPQTPVRGKALDQGATFVALRLGLRSTLRGMTEDTRPGDETAEPEKLPVLPRHLSALIGSLQGPADLGRNHDKYLTYADREAAGGAASA